MGDNIPSVSSFAQKESAEQNSDDIRTFAEEERTLSDPEDKGIESNSFKEPSDVSAGHRMIPFSYSGQAFHPNLDELSET